MSFLKLLVGRSAKGFIQPFCLRKVKSIRRYRSGISIQQEGVHSSIVIAGNGKFKFANRCGRNGVNTPTLEVKSFNELSDWIRFSGQLYFIGSEIGRPLG